MGTTAIQKEENSDENIRLCSVWNLFMGITGGGVKGYDGNVDGGGGIDDGGSADDSGHDAITVMMLAVVPHGGLFVIVVLMIEMVG